MLLEPEILTAIKSDSRQPPKEEDECCRITRRQTRPLSEGTQLRTPLLSPGGRPPHTREGEKRPCVVKKRLNYFRRVAFKRVGQRVLCVLESR